jgi:hypothetical protein
MTRIAIGRKNWLFIGSLRAGIRNASLMRLVASALRMELDVSMNLENILTHRLRWTAKLEELLPYFWRANHPEAVREYREQERRDKADVASVQAAKRRARSEQCKKNLHVRSIRTTPKTAKLESVALRSRFTSRASRQHTGVLNVPLPPRSMPI